MILSRFVRAIVVCASLIGVIVTTGHYVPLPEEIVQGIHYPAPGKEWFVDQLKLYAEHYLLGASHVVPSLIFMALIPLQLSKKIRSGWPVLHRWSGRLLIALTTIIAISAVLLSIVMPFGDWSETVGAVVISAGCLISLAMAFHYIRKRNISAHRTWVSYMLAFAFAPITMRFFFVTGIDGFGMDAREIFGACMLIGMIVNLMLVRWWLSRTGLTVDSQSVNRI